MQRTNFSWGQGVQFICFHMGNLCIAVSLGGIRGRALAISHYRTITARQTLRLWPPLFLRRS